MVPPVILNAVKNLPPYLPDRPQTRLSPRPGAPAYEKPPPKRVCLKVWTNGTTGTKAQAKSIILKGSMLILILLGLLLVCQYGNGINDGYKSRHCGSGHIGMWYLLASNQSHLGR